MSILDRCRKEGGGGSSKKTKKKIRPRKELSRGDRALKRKSEGGDTCAKIREMIRNSGWGEKGK